MGLSSRRWAAFACCLLLLVGGGGVFAADNPPGWKVVLIAGDPGAPAFDHATAAIRERLLARGVAPADVQMLSAIPSAAAREGGRLSRLDAVLSAIAQMHPSRGQGCLVFATSHGSYHEGLVMAPSEDYLTPAALDRALVAGCGEAPTVVVISGCFSGTFAQKPLARPNRIVLTAAREDRPSFGCGAGFEYTVYDRCLLAAFDRDPTWRAAYATIRSCVAAREQEMRFPASGPRAFFGGKVDGLEIPRAP